MASDEGRLRRSCHIVPGSNDRFLSKAFELDADELIFDLEDGVVTGEKASARSKVVMAISSSSSRANVAIRVNGWETNWTLRDVDTVVSGAGARIDDIVLPKVESVDHVVALDLVLSQLEREHHLEPGAIGVEAQIESAPGLLAAPLIAKQRRVDALIFGPLDFATSIGMPSVAVGEGIDVDITPVLMQIVVAARAGGVDAIDGPHVRVRDLDGLRSSAMASARLGFDGKWSIHPDQIDVLNSVFSPDREEFERAWRIIDAYRSLGAGDGRGAVVLDGSMVDEATHKLALNVVRRGERSGLVRSD